MSFYLYHILLPTLLAFAIDSLIGDPPCYPHPVRFLGFLNTQYEKICRRLFSKKLILSGFIAVCLVLATSLGLTYALLSLTIYLDQTVLANYQLTEGLGYLQTLMASLLIYVSIAARDLRDHAIRILRPLEANNLDSARYNLSMIVGRDTDKLNESQISRATIESVAENTVDGVTSPLFYALIFGPLGAIAYRAINTMDSMYAYKNEKYLYFGRCAAYLDDAANFLPARLTGLLMCLCAPLCGGSLKSAWRIMLRDGQKHPSPNSGISEAAVAGALQIQLGGTSTYAGVISKKETLGEATQTIQHIHIKRSIAIMYTSCLSFVVITTSIMTLLLDLVSFGY